MDFKAQCFRFVNHNDVVTRVALRVMGYSHVGTFLYFDADGIVSADRGHWFRFLDGGEGRIADLGKLGPDDAKDHCLEHGPSPHPSPASGRGGRTMGRYGIIYTLSPSGRGQG